MNEQQPPPHNEEAEKALLSIFLQHPDEFGEQAGELKAELFHLPHHRKLLNILTERFRTGKPLDLILLTAELRTDGKLEGLGGAATLAEIYGFEPSTAHWNKYLQVLRVERIKREALNTADALIAAGTNGYPDQIPSILNSASLNVEELTNNSQAGELSLLDQAYAIRFNPDEKPPPDEVVLTVGGIPIAARGNLTGLQGKGKVGKSSAAQSILGAAQRGQYSATGDTLQMEWQGGATGAIIHLDTEQSPADWHNLVNRSVSRSGLHEVSSRLVSFPLVKFARSERLSILREALERELDEKGSIDLVVIDGVADLCISPNDEAESLELISILMALAHEFNCAFVLVLHENPSTIEGKTRGHLGSELNRKAFANLRIDKDGEVSTIYGTDMRKREIPKAQGFCFAWDDEAGMHTFQGRSAGLSAAKAEDSKRREAREEMEKAWDLGNFEQFPLARNSELISAIGEREGNGPSKKPDAIKKRITKAETLGVITKTKSGAYRLNKEGNEGN